MSWYWRRGNRRKAWEKLAAMLRASGGHQAKDRRTRTDIEFPSSRRTGCCTSLKRKRRMLIFLRLRFRLVGLPGLLPPGSLRSRFAGIRHQANKILEEITA